MAEEPEKISQRKQLYITLAIQQYTDIYLPLAKQEGLKKITSERDYVARALENFENWETQSQQCQLLGHQPTTLHMYGKDVTACARCGVTEQLSDILFTPIAEKLKNATTEDSNAPNNGSKH